MSLSPLTYIIAAIVLLGMVATGVYRVKEWGAEEVRLEWANANKERREAEAKKANTAATALEADRGKSRIVYKTITEYVDREVEKPVYRNLCLEPRGLCLANAALLGKSADTCKLDGPVSVFDRPLRWERSFRSAKTDRG